MFIRYSSLNINARDIKFFSFDETFTSFGNYTGFLRDKRKHLMS
jgi:hypothetical protein